MKFQCTGVVFDIEDFIERIRILINITDLGKLHNYLDLDTDTSCKTIEWIISRLIDDVLPFLEVSEFYRHNQWYENSFYRIKSMYGSGFEIDFFKAIREVLPLRMIIPMKIIIEYRNKCLILRKHDGTSLF